MEAAAGLQKLSQAALPLVAAAAAPSVVGGTEAAEGEARAQAAGQAAKPPPRAPAAPQAACGEAAAEDLMRGNSRWPRRGRQAAWGKEEPEAYVRAARLVESADRVLAAVRDANDDAKMADAVSADNAGTTSARELGGVREQQRNGTHDAAAGRSFLAEAASPYPPEWPAAAVPRKRRSSLPVGPRLGRRWGATLAPLPPAGRAMHGEGRAAALRGEAWSKRASRLGRTQQGRPRDGSPPAQQQSLLLRGGGGAFEPDASAFDSQVLLQRGASGALFDSPGGAPFVLTDRAALGLADIAGSLVAAGCAAAPPAAGAGLLRPLLRPRSPRSPLLVPQTAEATASAVRVGGWSDADLLLVGSADDGAAAGWRLLGGGSPRFGRSPLLGRFAAASSSGGTTTPGRRRCLAGDSPSAFYAGGSVAAPGSGVGHEASYRGGHN